MLGDPGPAPRRRSDRTDRTWQHLGEMNPFFGVITDETNRSSAVDHVAIDRLYQSGEEYVRWIRDIVTQEFAGELTIASALDFGCGVGRITVPLAGWIGSAVGIDVSPGMLKEARLHSELHPDVDIRFVLSDESNLTALPHFGLVHSFIVFQHIEPAKGRTLAESLLDLVEDDGLAILHFPYRSSMSRSRRLRQGLYTRYPSVWATKNRLLRRKREPMIEMHLYDVSWLLGTLQDKGFHRVALRFSRHGEFDGIVAFAQKRSISFL